MDVNKADNDPDCGHTLVIQGGVLFASITRRNTFKPGCQSVLFIPVFPFLSGAYMLLSHSEKSRAGFVDDLRDGKHTGASNAPSI